MVATNRRIETRGEVLCEFLSPLGEVCEHKSSFAGGVDLLDDFFEAGEFAGTAIEWSVVVAVGHGVIADLLECSDRSEDAAIAIVGARFEGSASDETVEHCLVKTDLFGSHRTVIEFVDAVGKFGGNCRF